MLGDQADSVKTYCMLPSILSHSAQNKLSFAALLSFMIGVELPESADPVGSVLYGGL
jgi:hypothetical protein